MSIVELNHALSEHICASQVIIDLPTAIKELIENSLVLLSLLIVNRWMVLYDRMQERRQLRLLWVIMELI